MNLFKPKFWDNNEVSFFSILLFPIALLIKVLSLLKYSLTKSKRFSVPIICVGNIYLGGTGKTPLSMKLFTYSQPSLYLHPLCGSKYRDYL